MGTAQLHFVVSAVILGVDLIYFSRVTFHVFQNFAWLVERPVSLDT